MLPQLPHEELLRADLHNAEDSLNAAREANTDNQVSEEDDYARDLELQREIQDAGELFLHASGGERLVAKGHYLDLLGVFSARILGREPKVAEWILE